MLFRILTERTTNHSIKPWSEWIVWVLNTVCVVLGSRNARRPRQLQGGWHHSLRLPANSRDLEPWLQDSGERCLVCFPRPRRPTVMAATTEYNYRVQTDDLLKTKRRMPWNLICWFATHNEVSVQRNYEPGCLPGFRYCLNYGFSVSDAWLIKD